VSYLQINIPTDRTAGDPLDPALVRGLRKHHGLTQTEFAEQLGLCAAHVTVANWERGKTECRGPAAELILLKYTPTVYMVGNRFHKGQPQYLVNGPEGVRVVDAKLFAVERGIEAAYYSAGEDATVDWPEG